MTSNTSTKWYMTAAVAKAVRDRANAIEHYRDVKGDTRAAAANTAARNRLFKAYELAHKGGNIAHDLGVEWPTVQRRLGLLVTPDFLIAAQFGMPYAWSMSPLADNATVALAEIDTAFPPKPSRKRG